MEKILVPKKTLEMIDSLLVNLANEGRHYDKTRTRVLEALNSPKKYAIHPGGDIRFSDVKKEISHLGYKPINSDQHISRIGYNTIGVIFGNWICWTNEVWEELGYTIIEADQFLENPKSYIPQSPY